ncbi:RidA family protein [Amaricoccus sp.]|uniref:RidA family protein n=1 Tax=Amaricoccus sp. TaxID=1872485 RepID=UPI001B518DAB|nr:RidA family protein [Amaricoccus sp.]MBP7003588.1 RidA family protein [Amaricoccus sp.]
MPIQRFEPSGRMSAAVVHGDTVYLSGQVGAGATVAEQTRDALARVERLLGLAGSDKASILSVQVWLASMDDFAAMNAVFDAWVDKENQPARACGESRLARRELRVEILVIAARH